MFMQNQAGILRTKLYKPRVTLEHVFRSRLVNLIQDNLFKPLTLISAPAGYGKSMLMSSCLDVSEKSFVWLSLSENDNDLRLFLEYIIEGVHQKFPNSLIEVKNFLQAKELPPITVISDSLINNLDFIEEEIIIVLDDYHSISLESIHDIINLIIQSPPPNLHLVILTRTDPPLDTLTLRTYNRINEIRFNDLIFSKSEISLLGEKILGFTLKEKEIDKLCEITEGWIIGLHLAALSIKSINKADFLFKKNKGNIFLISEFLFSEVFETQGEDFKKILLETSILNRFCADLIDSLNESKLDSGEVSIDGNSYIQWLQRSNMFIISVDENNIWFRYHHLFQELLQEKLKENRTETEISKLHERAAKWFENNNSIEESLSHLKAGSNFDEACQIIVRHRMAELDEDKWYVVNRWLEKIPENVTDCYPEILFCKAWTAYENFQLEKIPPLLDQIKTLLEIGAKDEKLTGEWHLFHGLCNNWSGNAAIGLEHFQEASKLIPDNRKLVMGMLHLHIALARGIIGEYGIALAELNNLLTEERGNATYITRLLAGLFYVNQFAGNLSASAQSARRLLSVAQKNNLSYTIAMGVCMEGCSRFNSYKLFESERLFKLAARDRYILHRGTALDALAGLAVTQQLLQKPEEANKSLDLLESFEGEHSRTIGLPISDSCRARISLLRNDISSAIEWAEMFQGNLTFAGLFVWLEIPILTQIRVLIKHGTTASLDKANNLLNNFLETASKLNLTNQKIEALVLKSLLLEQKGASIEALKNLKEVINLAETGRWIRPFVELGEPIVKLLRKLHKQEKSLFISEILQHFDNIEKSKISLSFATGGINDLDALTNREIEIVRLISEGLKNKEIGEKLFLSNSTIKGYIYKIYQKLNVSSRIQAIQKIKEIDLSS